MQLIIFFSLIVTHTHASYPAIKAALSEKGLTEVSQMMSVWIQNKLKSMDLPEVRGGVDIGIGTVQYVLYNMRVAQCSLSGLTLAFVEGTGVSVQVSHMSLAVTGSWATQFGIIKDGGTFDLSVYSISINMLLQVGEDVSGRLSISSVSCSDDVRDVNMHFYGGASFLFQPFVSSFSGKITYMISKKICPATQQAIYALEDHLQHMPVNIHVDQFIYLSVPLMSSPTVTDDSLEIDLKGEFYSARSPSEPPFSAAAFELRCAGDVMLSLAASEFFVNSAVYSYFSSGLLQININDSMIPKFSPVHLNTSQFSSQFSIPQLGRLYPDMEMRVLLYASETPIFSFSPGDLDLQIPAAAKFSAVKADGSLVPLFRLDVITSFSGNVQIKDKHLSGAFKMNNLTLTLGSSEIGDFKTAPLERVLKMLVNTLVLPKLNALTVPVLMPKGFSLSNPKMVIKNGFLVILTDVEATPTDL